MPKSTEYRMQQVVNDDEYIPDEIKERKESCEFETKLIS